MIRKIAACAAMVLTSVSMLHAQGTVSFNNRVLNTDGVTFRVNAPVFNTDGVTALSGATYLAALYAGPVGGALAQVGAAVPFRTGTRVGYVDITSPDRTVATVAPGTAGSFQVRAWLASAGTTYETALVAGGPTGFSNTFSVTTGGAGSPASLPADLVGLQSFSLVPEPSVIALGLIGGCALLLRRKQA